MANVQGGSRTCQRINNMDRFPYLWWLIILSSTVAGQSIVNSNKCFNKPDLIDGTEVYMVVDKPPEYKGGLNQFYKDILQNIKHPRDRNKVEGKIILTFVIDSVGRVRNLCFIKPEDGRYDFQINELTEEVSKWAPGQLNNKKVGVRMLLPIIIEWK